jgi:hypothetical protein
LPKILRRLTFSFRRASFRKERANIARVSVPSRAGERESPEAVGKRVLRKRREAQLFVCSEGHEGFLLMNKCSLFLTLAVNARYRFTFCADQRVDPDGGR